MGTRALASEGPKGYLPAAAAAGGMTLSKSSPLGPDFLTYETGMPALPPAPVGQLGAPCLPPSLGWHRPIECQRDGRKQGRDFYSPSRLGGVSGWVLRLRHLLCAVLSCGVPATALSRQPSGLAMVTVLQLQAQALHPWLALPTPQPQPLELIPRLSSSGRAICSLQRSRPLWAGRRGSQRVCQPVARKRG